MGKPKWKPVKVRLGQIKAWEQNPRMSTKAQAQRIIASERKFGQPVPFLLMPEVDGLFPLLDGHQRLAAWFTVYGAEYVMDAMVSDRPLTEAEHKELVITLHTGATGSWNWDALSGWGAGDLQAWGMDADTKKGWDNDANNLKELLEAENAEPVDAEPQIDRAGELQEKWQTASGQLWKLGEHRLLIGDCTVRENVERLMGGELCSLIVTDPPYGVDYEGGANNEKKREKLHGDDTPMLYDAFLKVAPVSDKCALYIWHGGGANITVEVYKSVIDNKYTIRNLIIWHKLKAHYGAYMAQYKQKHEPCLYCVKGAPEFIGATNEVTVWEYDQPSRNEFHPTEKPIQVMQRAIGNHPYNLVYDAFAGSGTTIIAAHNLNRRAFAMEISEKYGAVILQRFQDATGIAPELIDTK